MWYVFHGPNTLARDEALAQLQAKLGPPEVAALNLTLLERDTSVHALISACNALPFLAEHRLKCCT